MGYSYGGANPISELTLIEIKQLKLGESRLSETREFASDPEKGVRKLMRKRNQQVRNRNNGS